MFRFWRVFIVGVAISLAGTVHGLSQTEKAREPHALSQLPTLSPSGFTMSDYRELKARDVQTAQLILQAMREAVFLSVRERSGSSRPLVGRLSASWGRW